MNNVDIPNSVTKIALDAFSDCSGLADLFIPAYVSEISVAGFREYGPDLESFHVDPNNKYYVAEDGILYDKAKHMLVCCPKRKTGDLDIPYGVEKIGTGALGFCEYLTSITIPESVKEIANGAFAYLRSVKTLVIPESVTRIAWDAFWSVLHIACHAPLESENNWGALSRN